jgi:hypothetical protein
MIEVNRLSVGTAEEGIGLCDERRRSLRPDDAATSRLTSTGGRGPLGSRSDPELGD